MIGSSEVLPKSHLRKQFRPVGALTCCSSEIVLKLLRAHEVHGLLLETLSPKQILGLLETLWLRQWKPMRKLKSPILSSQPSWQHFMPNVGPYYCNSLPFGPFMRADLDQDIARSPAPSQWKAHPPEEAV